MAAATAVFIVTDRSDCYHIENFDQVKAKEHALEIIRDDLRRKTKKGVVATGAMSDPYNPFEKELMLTRHAQELLNAFGFGSAIATKSAMITRDIDILEEIKEHSPVICKLTITTCDDSMCKKIEPGVSLSSERFEALAKLKDAGNFCRNFNDAGASVDRGYRRKYSWYRKEGERMRSRFYLSCLWSDIEAESERMVF